MPLYDENAYELCLKQLFQDVLGWDYVFMPVTVDIGSQEPVRAFAAGPFLSFAKDD